MIELKKGAIIIADVHYDDERLDFEEFLEFILTKRPPQLILLGDIFNLLIGGIKPSIKVNQNIINKLNKLAKSIEIIYFEGNHDFNLEGIFTNIKIIKSQPILANFEGKIIAISHGDVFLPFITKIALKTLRFRFVIFILNLLNTICFNKIYKKICNSQKVKKLYKKLNNFENIVKLRIKNYQNKFHKNIDYIIEGHFHQGGKYTYNGVIYKNLEAFANERSFFILECPDKIIKVKLPKKE